MRWNYYFHLRKGRQRKMPRMQSPHPRRPPCDIPMPRSCTPPEPPHRSQRRRHLGPPRPTYPDHVHTTTEQSTRRSTGFLSYHLHLISLTVSLTVVSLTVISSCQSIIPSISQSIALVYCASARRLTTSSLESSSDCRGRTMYLHTGLNVCNEYLNKKKTKKKTTST